MNTRKLPLVIKVKLLFANKLVYTGLFIFSISLILLLGFAPNTDFDAHKYEADNTKITEGILKSISETNTTVNENRIFKYSFEYYLGEDVLSGNSYGKSNGIKIGESIQVQYVVDEPIISRIVDTTNGSFSLETLYFLCVLFLIGAPILLFPIYTKIRLLKVISSGFEIVQAKLIDYWQVPFVTISKNQSLYKFTFEFTLNGILTRFTRYYPDSNFFNKSTSYQTIVSSKDSSESFVIQSLPKTIRDYLTE